MIRRAIFLAVFLAFCACNSKSRIEDAIDIANGVPRKTIDTSKMGVNAFANDGRFGAIDTQFSEVKNTLKLKFVRVLLSWDDGVQSSPGAAPNFGFYDALLDGVPSGVDVLVVLTHVPTWMQSSGNWIDGNPRKTFVENWVKPVVSRYRGRGSIKGYEIWNEPNQIENPENTTMGLAGNPENYVELLGFAFSAIKDISGGSLVVSASTTSINQNYPDSINYNKGMKAAGAEQFADRWGIHYYGKQFEKVITSDGIQDFLNSVSIPVWVTESGAQGIDQQLAYVEQAWPFLSEKIPGIERFYYYQFTEATDPSVTYGLKNLSSSAPVSDLYTYLRDR